MKTLDVLIVRLSFYALILQWKHYKFLMAILDTFIFDKLKFNIKLSLAWLVCFKIIKYNGKLGIIYNIV